MSDPPPERLARRLARRAEVRYPSDIHKDREAGRQEAIVLFAIFCTDRPGALETRMSNRPTHLAWLESHVTELVSAGALLDPEGKPCGSLLVIEAADRAAAEAFTAADPYAHAGLFESTVIRPHRLAFKDGKRLA